MNDFILYDQNDSLGYLRGNISGWLRSQTSDQYFTESDDAAIFESLVKQSSEFYENYARYIICLNDLAEDNMKQLLKNPGFISSNKQLHNIVTDALVRKTS